MFEVVGSSNKIIKFNTTRRTSGSQNFVICKVHDFGRVPEYKALDRCT